MAYSFPATISTGDVLTASTWNQAIRENQKFGMATFTNEAARDSAITSPEEGMMAYLTAATVPAATGATTAVPTGVKTIYNGSAWVCVTPVGASSGTNGTTTAGYVSTLTGDGTAISVTLVTGTTALINMGCWGSIAAGSQQLLSFAVSGATTLAAADAQAIYMGTGGVNITSHKSYIYTGLTAGTNTFTLNYKSLGGGTAAYANRWLVVSGVA